MVRMRFSAILLLLIILLAVACSPDGTVAPPADRPYLLVLGVAQDGGIPQAGSLDHPAWEDERLRRHPVSLALVDPASGSRWLFEAGPALPAQLHDLDRVASRPVEAAAPALSGVFLTHAHIGHYAGLMFLGHEAIGARGMPVHVMPRMAEFLERNGPWDQLVRYGNIEVRRMAASGPEVLNERLRVTPIPVPHRQEYSEVVGFRIEGPGRSVLFIPDIDSWADLDEAGTAIEDLIASVDVALLDGTFWADGEVPGRDMSAFPHPRISKSLDRFAALPASERSKIHFIHFNHTNPAARPGSPEGRAVEAAGSHLAEEGQVFPLGDDTGSG